MEKLTFVLLLICLFSYAYCEMLSDCEKAPKGIYVPDSNIYATQKVENQIVHSGNQSYKCSWDFSKVEEGFANYDFLIDTTGVIKSVSFWVYAQKPMVGRSLTVRCTDKNNEFYFGSAKIENEGWNHLKAIISVSPAWPTGDKNNIQDIPMKFNCITVDYMEDLPKGTIYLDDIEAEVIIPEDVVLDEYIKPTVDFEGLEKIKKTEVMTDLEDLTSESCSCYVTDREHFFAKESLTNKAHSGKQALQLYWKFDPEYDGGYNVYGLSARSIAQIKKVFFWAYAEEKDLGVRLSLWVQDRYGEMYTGTTTIDKTGWNQYTMNISDFSPWKSGDGNSIPDVPMNVINILVERSGAPLEGSVIIDDFTWEVESPYTMYVKNTLYSPKNDYLNVWNSKGKLKLKIENLTQRNIKNLSYKLDIWDMRKNKVVKSVKINPFNIADKKVIEKDIPYDLPYSYNTIYLSTYENGRLINFEEYPFTIINGKCGVNIPPAYEKYMYLCSPFGGATHRHAGPFMRALGNRWDRAEYDSWKGIEYEKDKYQLDGLFSLLDNRIANGIYPTLLMCTYNQPTWRTYYHTDFAPAYGKLFDVISKEKKFFRYELGNEDNGPQKKAYSEIGRNAYAAIRKNDSGAFVSPCGTAGVDLSFFQVQYKRNFLDRYDYFIVHPYCQNNNPELVVYNEGQSMIDYIDKVGGFKELWSTEYGYNDGSEGNSVLPDYVRGQYYVRHTLLQIATGYTRCGVFCFNGYWGVFQNHGYLRGLAFVTMTKRLEGYKYAGMLSNGPNVYAMVFEKFGKKPCIVAWTIEGEEDNPYIGTYYDSYGNKLTKAPKLSPDPTYIYGFNDKEIINAYDWFVNRELVRINNLTGEKLTGKEDPEIQWKTLQNLGENIKDTSKSAAAFHLLKALMVEGRYNKIVDLPKVNDFTKQIKDFLEKNRLEDKEYRKARWALNEYEKLDSERLYALESKDSAFANRLQKAQNLIANFTLNYLMNDNDLKQYVVWAYPYDNKGEDLIEKISFIPDVPNKIKFRVNNYANNPHKAKFSLELPEGWKGSEPVEINLTPNKTEEIYFEITAINTPVKERFIKVISELDNGASNADIYDEIDINPSVAVKVQPVQGILPITPMVCKLRNYATSESKGKIFILCDGKELGSSEIALKGLEEKQIEVKLSEEPANYDKMSYRTEIENYKPYKEEFRCEWTYAPKATKTLSSGEEMTKFPLYMDKEEYTFESFRGGWTPGDLSGEMFFKWDEKYLYARIKITDQVHFQVSKRGDDTYMYDSVQIDVINAKNERYQISMGDIGDKDVVYGYCSLNGFLDFPVKIDRVGTITDYFVAIPWEKVKIENPKVGDMVRVEILFNDHDMVNGRRCMERFSSNIFMPGVDYSNYGQLILGE